MKAAPPPPPPKFKRSLKNFLIMPRYQLRYAGLMNVVALTMLLLSYFNVKALYSVALESCAEVGIQNSDISAVIFAFFAFFLVISTALGIYFSHRTAGPMYRFSKIFNSAQKGNYYERVKLRPGDDFHDVAEAFNRLMDRVQTELEGKVSGRPSPAPTSPADDGVITLEEKKK